MREQTSEWLRSLLPPATTASASERGRALAGALIGLLLTAALSQLALGQLALGTPASAVLVAPMGASAVLLFCLPASPLAQPWSVVGGNVVSALVGVTCARWIAEPLLAAPLAAALAIGAMFWLRCLHPPGGAVALTTVLGGSAVHEAGYWFALAPVGLDSLLLALAAVVFNNLTGRRYPHRQQSTLKNVHATRDPVPTARLGFTKEDLDAALAHYGQVLDVSRDDLEAIIFETEMQAYGRRFGVIRCGDIMSTDVVTVTPSTPVAAAWALLRQHRLHALPVIDREGRVAGIVSHTDFWRGGGLDDVARVRQLASRLRRLVHGETVAGIMTTQVTTAARDEPITELVPLMANTGLHHVPVVDADGLFAGMVSQSDLLAALYETRLSA
jgi:CBS domain-containing membrane protein